MRTDPLKGEEVRAESSFEASSRKAAAELESDSWGKESLSGNERNRLFLNHSGKQFCPEVAAAFIALCNDGQLPS